MCAGRRRRLRCRFLLGISFSSESGGFLLTRPEAADSGRFSGKEIKRMNVKGLLAEYSFLLSSANTNRIHLIQRGAEGLSI